MQQKRETDRYGKAHRSKPACRRCAAAASAVMGVATFIVYKGVYFVLHINAIATLLAIIVAVVVYAVALLKFHGLTEEELYSFPKGTTLSVYLKRFHLI